MPARTAARPEFRLIWLAEPSNIDTVLVAAVSTLSAGTTKVAKPPVGAATEIVVLAVAVDAPEAADCALE